jgi:hypothetical protein
MGLLVELDGLLEVDDVDAVSGPEDEGAHLGVPTTGLVTEVDTGLEQLFHGHVRHRISLGFSSASQASHRTARHPGKKAKRVFSGNDG